MRSLFSLAAQALTAMDQQERDGGAGGTDDRSVAGSDIFNESFPELAGSQNGSYQAPAAPIPEWSPWGTVAKTVNAAAAFQAAPKVSSQSTPSAAYDVQVYGVSTSTPPLAYDVRRPMVSIVALGWSWGCSVAPAASCIFVS